jgi:hypothetical protein
LPASPSNSPALPQSTVMLGDCLDLMKEVADASVDMILTDLPYGTTSNKWDAVIPLDQLWSAWKRICKPGAPIVLFTQQPFTTTVAASNLKQLKTEWIWEKPQGTGFLNANRYPLKNQKTSSCSATERLHIIHRRQPARSPIRPDVAERPPTMEHSRSSRRSTPMVPVTLRRSSHLTKRRAITRHRSLLRCWNTSSRRIPIPV